MSVQNIINGMLLQYSYFIVILLSMRIVITRREFLREIIYKNIAIIAIQHIKMHFVDTFGDFSHTVE